MGIIDDGARFGSFFRPPESGSTALFFFPSPLLVLLAGQRLRKERGSEPASLCFSWRRAAETDSSDSGHDVSVGTFPFSLFCRSDRRADFFRRKPPMFTTTMLQHAIPLALSLLRRRGKGPNGSHFLNCWTTETKYGVF